MRKPRVCIAINTFYPIIGGAEHQAFIQARMLHSHGYPVMVVTFRQKFTWVPYEILDGVPVTRLGGRLLSERERFLPVMKRLRYFLGLCLLAWTLWQRRASYDILHVYHMNMFALPVALVSLLAHKPLIVGVRSASTDPLKGSENDVTLIAGPLDKDASWLRVPGPLQLGGDLNDLERLGPVGLRLARFLFSRPHVMIVVLSSFMKTYLQTRHFSTAHMQFIPNGVDVARFSPAPADVAPSVRAQSVVCVAKLCYRKGTDVLLQAWRYVQKEFPDARLRLVGKGPIHDQLQRMVQELGIEQTVEFVGLQSDVSPYLRNASIAVLPSRIEGMPNALLEAMACGLACVATRVSGSEDIIQSGVNGLLVDSENYEAMAQALLALLRDPELAAHYGQVAHQHIEQYYAQERITDAYLKLYQFLLDDRLRSDKQRYVKRRTNPLQRGFERILRYVWNSRLY
jgi:glycosyltransferase involved in cell wall biosynthesis